MMRGQAVKVNNPQWDRCARTAVITVGNKEIPTPSFCASISSETELQLLIDSLGLYDLKHVKMLTVRMNDAERVKELMSAARGQQLTFDGKIANQYEIQFINNVTKIIDPATEYTFYEERTKELSKSPRTQKDLKSTFLKLERLHEKKRKGKLTTKDHFAQVKAVHEEFWRSMLSDVRLRTRLVTETFNQETLCGADIGLAPVPLVYNEEMLNITKELNRIGRIVWTDDNCATYVVLQSTVFNSEALVDKIIEYIKEVPTKFIVIKIKNLEIDTRDKIEQRIEFKKLLKAINDIKHNAKDEKVFMLLESGHQFYPSAAGGFDIVSTSLRGIDKDFSFFGKHKGEGGMFDINTLTIRNVDQVRKMLRNKSWRCKCQVCFNLKEEDIIKDNWNYLRRVHYLLAVNNLLLELNKYIEAKTIELAREKIKDSAISNLKQVLPLEL